MNVIWRLLRGVPKKAAAEYAPHARGRHAETLACEFLQQRQLKLVARNYRCASGEIDLIMQDDDTLVFVEVRARRNDTYGRGADTVGKRKQAKISATAALYLQAQRQNNIQACRFDVVSISFAVEPPGIDWIPDAFDATNF